jgi:muramidase (phage lysozyme)
MPNSEYLRLKALLQNNPEYKRFLDGISKAEGTWNDDPYSTKFGGGKVDWRKGKDRKSNGVSNAHGKYQFMNTTWDELASELDLTDFSPEAQDIAALKLLERKGSLKEIDEGNFEKAIYKASSVWAALPKNAKGESGLTYKNGKPQKAKPLAKILSYIESPEANRAKINDGFQQKNESNAKEYREAWNYIKSNEIAEANYKEKLSKIPTGKGYKEKKQKLDAQYEGILSFRRKEKEEKAGKIVNKYEKEIDVYWKKVSEIQGRKDLSPAQKNLEKHNVKNEFYRKGLMSSVNVNVAKKQVEFNAFKNKLEKLGTETDLIDETTGEIDLNNSSINEEQLKELKNEALKFGINLNPKIYYQGGYDKPQKPNQKGFVPKTEIKNLVNKVDQLYTLPGIEPGLLKYGITREEYDILYPSAPEESTTTDTTNTNDVMPDGSTSKTPEEIQIERAEAERQRKVQEAEAKEKNDISNFLGGLNEEDDEFTSAQFQYKAGKQEIPFNALINLGTGIIGATEADSVDIKYRDEQISEGIIAYRNDLGKIKQMGLPPDIEGGLRMKLADAYQTGLTNIVRASNGNRNLVLGNQGQLDQARMTGLVDIAVQDLERSDKAMAIFGELEQYINDFDSKRDIANNERRYTEDNLKRTSAMTVAQNGMAGFIDAIQNAKENAPGSMNDMRRQYFQFVATGISPGAKAGEVGSPEYRDAKKAEREILTQKKKDGKAWILNQSLEDQKTIAKLIIENPSLDVTKNTSDGTLDSLILEFEKTNGTKEKKNTFNESKGIGEVRANESENASKEALGKPKTDLVETIPYNRYEQAVPTKKYPTLVTNGKVPDKTFLDQLGKALNGFETGVQTINPDKMEQQSVQEENMNSLITTQK